MNWPLNNPTITQPFAANPGDYDQFGYPAHNGLDLWTGDAPPWVYAFETGIVEKVGWEAGGYGKYVVLRHLISGLLVFSYYAHLQTVYAHTGQPLGAGFVLGEMGSTGNSSGPHLHFGIRNEYYIGPYKGFIDPLPILRGSGIPWAKETDIDSSPLSPPAGRPPSKPWVLPGSFGRLVPAIIGRHGRTMYRMKKQF